MSILYLFRSFSSFFNSFSKRNELQTIVGTVLCITFLQQSRTPYVFPYRALTFAPGSREEPGISVRNDVRAGIVWDTPSSHSQIARVRAQRRPRDTKQHITGPVQIGRSLAKRALLCLHRQGWVWFSKLSSVSRKSTLGPLAPHFERQRPREKWNFVGEIRGVGFPKERWRTFTLWRGH